MRLNVTAILIAALLPSAADAGAFSVDPLKAGEGHEGDCYTWLAREGSRPAREEDSPPSVFDDSGDGGYIKLSGKVYFVPFVTSRESGKTTIRSFRDPKVKVAVETSLLTTRIDKSESGNTVYLKGTIKVSYKGQLQTLRVAGEDFCYAG